MNRTHDYTKSERSGEYIPNCDLGLPCGCKKRSTCKHLNAKRDSIEKLNYCPDCGHEWGSGRAHY